MIFPFNIKYEERIYRNLISKENLESYNIVVGESDLFISSDVNLAAEIKESLIKHRFRLESYIKKNPHFLKSMLPLPHDKLAPAIVRDMLEKGSLCGVGPMASVAGALAQFVGKDVMASAQTIIIENGGDIFLKTNNKLIVSVFAGKSPLSYKVKFAINPERTPLGICTSSATVGPSVSFGKADAVCVISPSATLADAAASAIGNKVKNKNDIKKALAYGMKIKSIEGIIIIIGEEMGVIGDITLL
ncbi:MAG: UPF0280 family protein [Syntrophaceae bacterium]|nr:UPF0280 family protein [Syntrophaceae bacterium]MBP8607999.1 UPF0280 family protein [Syntrophaceae bacterium]HQM42167.1 UPF0280 family protein [Smithellaceae bacterium]